MSGDATPAVGEPVVGFVGLGQMGGTIAVRISERFHVVAHDTDPATLAARPSLHPAADLADLARSADIVCLCLPSADVCQAVATELFAVPDTRARVLIELSTIGPEPVQRTAAAAVAAGWALVDAPVSGGVRAAPGGELTVMAAADDAALSRARPVLEQLARKVFVMGDRPGLGQVMKLTNNVIALSALPLTSEALSMGATHGLGLEDMIEVINASSGRTQRSEFMFPETILPERYDYGAVGEITYKDVSLFVAEATRVGSPTTISSLVQRLYGDFVAHHPQTDYSYLHQHVLDGAEGLRAQGEDG